MLRWVLSLLILSAVAVLPVACGVDPDVQCESNDECFDGYACDTLNRVCLRACETATESTDCLASQFCDVDDGQSTGVCRAASSSAADSQIR